jgi:hypothetical protein
MARIPCIIVAGSLAHERVDHGQATQAWIVKVVERTRVCAWKSSTPTPADKHLLNHHMPIHKPTIIQASTITNPVIFCGRICPFRYGVLEKAIHRTARSVGSKYSIVILHTNKWRT